MSADERLDIIEERLSLLEDMERRLSVLESRIAGTPQASGKQRASRATPKKSGGRLVGLVMNPVILGPMISKKMRMVRAEVGDFIQEVRPRNSIFQEVSDVLEDDLSDYDVFIIITQGSPRFDTVLNEEMMKRIVATGKPWGAVQDITTLEIGRGNTFSQRYPNSVGNTRWGLQTSDYEEFFTREEKRAESKEGVRQLLRALDLLV